MRCLVSGADTAPQVLAAGAGAGAARLRFKGNAAMAIPWVGDARPGDRERETLQRHTEREREMQCQRRIRMLLLCGLKERVVGAGELVGEDNEFCVPEKDLPLE